MDELNYLLAVQNGQLVFADGSTRAIPHWGESAYTHIFCVRHAEKDRDELHNPGLDAMGKARAEHLGRVLAEAGLDAVFVTPYRRAQDTAEPVVRRGNTAPAQIYFPEDQEEWIAEVLQTYQGKKLLIVGHQFTIPHLLNQLHGHGFDFENIPDSDCGQFFVVSTLGIGHSEILTTRY